MLPNALSPPRAAKPAAGDAGPSGSPGNTSTSGSPGQEQSAAAWHSVRWTAAGNLLRTLLSTAQLLVIARLVDVAEFGLAVLVGSLLLMVQQVADAGLSTALIRFRDVSDAEKSSLFWLNAALGAVLTVGMVLSAPLLAAAFAAPALAGMLRIAAVVFLAQGLFLQLRVLAERELRFGAVVRIELAGTASGFAVAVALALDGAGAMAVVWGQVASAMVQLACSFAFLTRDWRPTWHFRWTEAARFLPYGIDMFLVNLATALTVQIDVILAGLAFPKQAFGAFAQPRDLSLKVMTAINPVVTRVGMPLLARYQDEPAEAGRIYLRVVRMSASVCFPVYGAMAFLARDLLPLALGAKWGPAASLMPPIALWFALRSVVNSLGSYLTAMARSRLVLFYQIGFASIVAAAAWLGSRFGPVGLALAMAAAYLSFAMVAWGFVLRPISGVRFNAYFRQIALPALATLIGLGSALAARAVLGPGLPMLALASACGAGVFLLASYTVNRAGFDEVTRFLGLGRAR